METEIVPDALHCGIYSVISFAAMIYICSK